MKTKLFLLLVSAMFASQASALSLRGAISGGIVGSVFGDPGTGIIVGANGGVEPTLEDLAKWADDLHDLTTQFNITNPELNDRIQAEVTEVVLLGLDKLGFDFVAEELFWQAYKGFTHHVSSGAVEFSPSAAFIADYKAKYQKYYKVDINDITFYQTDNPPGGMAFADCYNIYFPYGDTGVSWVRYNNLPGGNVTTKIKLLHELKHSDQCNDLGSRREYGIYWIRNIIATGAVNSEDLIKAGLNGFDFTEFHDKMPMEIDAETHANAVVNADGQDVAVSSLVSPKSKLASIVINTSLLMQQ